MVSSVSYMRWTVNEGFVIFCFRDYDCNIPLFSFFIQNSPIHRFPLSFKITASFFIVIAFIYVCGYTYIVLNITCLACIMLSVCMFYKLDNQMVCSFLRRAISVAPSFLWLLIVLCVGCKASWAFPHPISPAPPVSLYPQISVVFVSH